MKKNFYVVLVSIMLIVVVIISIKSLVSKKRPVSKGTPRSSLTALYNEARLLESKGQYLDAQVLYRDLLEKSRDGELVQRAQNDLMNLNMKILFSPIITEDSVLYAVKKGDTLSSIAKRFNTTVELIINSNNLESDTIRVGKKLKISTAKYSVVIDRSQNILTLKSDESVLKTYKVATGIDNSTPLGTFKIINKLKDPVWYKTGAIVPSGSPENILGSRWLGLSISGYGIHGTTEPESIGKHVTAGCVRMGEPDVHELYSILPVGVEVTIID